MKKLILGSLVLVNLVFGSEIYATLDVQAKQSANLAFSSGGTIGSINVDVGTILKKGEVLAKLNNNDLKASLEIAATSLKFAKKDLARQDKVRKIIDKAKYDSYKQKFESANAQVKYQQAILNKTLLKAPFDAVVVSKEVEVGDVVTGANPKTAFIVQSKSKRKLVLKFDQKHASKVKAGDTFKYKLDGDDKLYKGTISKVYPAIDTKTRKITAEVEASNIVVGLFGDGYITSK